MIDSDIYLKHHNHGFIEIVFCNCLSFISTFQSNYKQIGFTINYMESIVFLIAYQRYLTGFDGRKFGNGAEFSSRFGLSSVSVYRTTILDV